jgi:hypothetical protein
MKKQNRIIMELFAPPFLAALSVIIFSSHDSQTLYDWLVGGPVIIIFAYVFGIVPAGIYTFAMELWFGFGFRARCGLLCTIIFSALLGAGAGFLSAGIGVLLRFLISLDCERFSITGAVIGLLVGFCVSWKQPLPAKNEKPVLH